MSTSSGNADQLVAPAPEHCPGTGSESAGQADACQGCPNKEICSSSKPKGPDPDVEVIAKRLAGVRHKILVLSGKGGVGERTLCRNFVIDRNYQQSLSNSLRASGKSTVTGMLARGLAASSQDTNVGVLDVDLCGPSIPRVFGAVGEQVRYFFFGKQNLSSQQDE